MVAVAVPALVGRKVAVGLKVCVTSGVGVRVLAGCFVALVAVGAGGS